MTSELPPDRWAAQDHAVLVEATRRIEERGHMSAVTHVLDVTRRRSVSQGYGPPLKAPSTG